MIKDSKDDTNALIVSAYELVQSGMKALLLKVKTAPFSHIVECANTSDALKVYEAAPFKVVLMDDSIIVREGIEHAVGLIKQMKESIVLCFVFRYDEAVMQQLKQAGLRGYFLGTIAPKVFASDVEKLIAGDCLNLEGIVLCKQML